MQPEISLKKSKSRRRKRCKNCSDLFEPNLRTKGRQNYCSKTGCQKVRQRNNEKDWRARNPEKQRIYVRLWNKRNSEYSGKRRAKNPKLLEMNRRQTCLRMQKARAKAMFDKSKLILTQLAENKADKCYLTRGGWVILRLTKARSFTRRAVIGHNQSNFKRVANRLPKGRLYDLSEEILNQSRSGP
jgi:2-oxoglutarate dehydrogenase complex dehydrogenase (E1) component-like enzyme